MTWTSIIALARAAIELARDIAGRSKTQQAPQTDDTNPQAARAGTVAGAAAYEAGKRAQRSRVD